MDRGAWWATVHRVAKSQARLKRLGLHTQSPHRTSLSLAAWKNPFQFEPSYPMLLLEQA